MTQVLTQRLFIYMKPDQHHKDSWTDEVLCHDLEEGYRRLRSLKKGSYHAFAFKRISLVQEQVR